MRSRGVCLTRVVSDSQKLLRVVSVQRSSETETDKPKGCDWTEFGSAGLCLCHNGNPAPGEKTRRGRLQAGRLVRQSGGAEEDDHRPNEGKNNEAIRTWFV